MIRNPTITRTEPPIFKLLKFVPRKTKSTTALSGMPSTVPRAMKRGNVTAIPKLIRKLNAVVIKKSV